MKDLLRKIPHELRINHSVCDQFRGIQLQDRRVSSDLRVCQRLSEGRLVQLVVPMSPVANNVHHTVLVKGLSPFRSDPADVDHGLDVIAVDVEDRRLDTLGYVGAVVGRSGGTRVSGEPDHVVDDDVDCAPSCICWDLRQLHHFCYNPLTTEGSVTMQQHSHDSLHLLVVDEELLRPRLPYDDRVHSLQVRRVGRKIHMNKFPPEVPDCVSPEMVLNISHRDISLSKLVAESSERFSEQVGKNIQPATMRHPELNSLYTQLGSSCNEGMEAKEDSLCTFDAESFYSRKLVSEEAFKMVSPQQNLKSFHFLLSAQSPELVPLEEILVPLLLPWVPPLKNRLDPAPLEPVGQVRILYRRAPTVGCAHELDDIMDAPISLGMSEELMANGEPLVRVDIFQSEHGEVETVGVVLQQPADVYCICVDPVDGLVRVQLLVGAATERVKHGGEVSSMAEGVDHVAQAKRDRRQSLAVFLRYGWPFHLQGIPIGSL
mmetsp:Transcript_9705/g.32459  ORF Transcript_9705/g.32459 Transcript_9705/m.32459 type:complete len:488 (+) Transcript_9705:1026-2489(+)